MPQELPAHLLFFNRKNNNLLEFVVVKKREVVRKVSATGTVKPVKEIELGFEINGKVSQVRAKVGEKVNAGQIIMTLSNQDLQADLSEAKASLESAKADLLQYKAALDQRKQN